MMSGVEGSSQGIKVNALIPMMSRPMEPEVEENMYDSAGPGLTLEADLESGEKIAVTRFFKP